MTDTTTSPSVGTATAEDVGGSTAGGNAAQTLAQAAASLAAAATSLSEMQNKIASSLASLSENVNKIASGDTNVDSSDTVNDMRSVENVTGIHGVESIRASAAQGVHDSADFQRRSRHHFDDAVVRAQSHLDALRNVEVQALQNSVENANLAAKRVLRHTENTSETDNLVGKQAVRHADTQLFETSIGEGATSNMALGSIVNDLLAATASLKASAQQLAVSTVPTSGGVAPAAAR